MKNASVPTISYLKAFFVYLIAGIIASFAAGAVGGSLLSLAGMLFAWTVPAIGFLITGAISGIITQFFIFRWVIQNHILLQTTQTHVD